MRGILLHNKEPGLMMVRDITIAGPSTSQPPPFSALCPSRTQAEEDIHVTPSPSPTSVETAASAQLFLGSYDARGVTMFPRILRIRLYSHQQ
jgi:hypothetical protein